MDADKCWDGWTKTEVPVDSGAVDSVLPKDWFPHVQMEESEKSRKNGKYAIANGSLIQNYGQKSIRFRTDQQKDKAVMFQVTDVRRPLLSANRLRQKGYDVLLTSNPKLVNTKTGEVIELIEKNGLFLLNMWVKKDTVGDFPRPGTA